MTTLMKRSIIHALNAGQKILNAVEF